MSLEITVICDGCGAVIAGGKTGAEARRDARDCGARTGLPGDADICRDCDGRAGEQP